MLHLFYLFDDFIEKKIANANATQAEILFTYLFT